MGSPKLSLRLAPDSPPIGAIALRRLLGCSRIARVVVVANERDPLDWLAGERFGAHRSRIVVVRCRTAEAGMSHSLRSGMREARGASPDGVVIALADMPFVTTRLYERLLDAFASDAAPIYAASAAEPEAEPMPPALVGPALYDELDRLTGDAGARKLLHATSARGARVLAEAKEELIDVDDPDRLAEARELWVAHHRGGDEHGAWK